MEEIKKVFSGSKKWLLISDGVILLVIVAIVLAFYLNFQFIANLRSDFNDTTQALNTRLANFEAALATTSLSAQELAQRIKEQQDNFEDTIDDISDTVGTLEKLSKTDKELLQKYSRVYFLSDNYVPLRLSTIPEKYVLDPKREMQFHSSALTYLKRMLDRATSKGIDLRVSSAYRSFGTQSGLKASYLVTYGSGANAFSADQGYSEHQLGTTVDLVASSTPYLTVDFEKSEAFAWLESNAYKYGFVLSYPKGNAYYQYEPWHWRFVGVDLATDLHNDGRTLADLDQREIDTYLVKIFD